MLAFETFRFGVVGCDLAVDLVTIDVIIGQCSIYLSYRDVAVLPRDLFDRVTESIPLDDSVNGNASPYYSWATMPNVRATCQKCFNADTHNKIILPRSFSSHSRLHPPAHKVLRGH